MNSIDYSSLEVALARSEAALGAAESHGVLCGLLCCRETLDVEEWAAHVFEEDADGDVLQSESLELMQDLLDAGRAALSDPQLNFQPLLPGDETDLAERARALAAWTQGFVFGLGAGGLDREWRLSSDSEELLADFEKLSRADFDQDEAEEQDETDYAEIVEYLRVGVLVINRELLPLRDPEGAEAARAGADLIDEERTLH